MHPNASVSTIAEIPCACGCGRNFVPRKPWQRFASQECRTAYYGRQRQNGLHATVTGVRRLKRGAVSVTLRFGFAEMARALKIELGSSIEVLDQTPETR